MLDAVTLNYEKPLAWMTVFMPLEDKTPSVEELANSFGEDSIIFRVGQKMMCVSTSRDWQSDDLFIMIVENGYVSDLKKERSYWVPAAFETDEKGGNVEVSREDEKALVDFLAERNLKGLEWRKQQGEKPVTYRVTSSHFSAENGIVYENPVPPDNPPDRRKDKRLDQ